MTECFWILLIVVGVSCGVAGAVFVNLIGKWLMPGCYRPNTEDE